MLAFLFVLLATSAAAPAFAEIRTDDQFCNRVQQLILGTQLLARNQLHADYEAFKESKSTLDPYTTQQFVLHEDESGQRPMRISCKFKSADHLNAVYGAGTASTTPRACRDANRDTIQRVYRAIPAAERAALPLPPARILLDGDDIQIMGSRYVAPYQFVYLAPDGTLHIAAKALLVNWDDWRWKLAPDKFRGAHYCHLIAPEYAARLMRGEVSAQPRSDQP